MDDGLDKFIKEMGGRGIFLTTIILNQIAIMIA